MLCKSPAEQELDGWHGRDRTVLCTLLTSLWWFLLEILDIQPQLRKLSQVGPILSTKRTG
jgi:hypothetical protein